MIGRTVSLGCLSSSHRRQQRGERILKRAVKRDHDLQPDDLEDPAYVVVVADDSQRTASFAQPLQGADENADRGGIDESSVGQVDGDQPVAVVDPLNDPLLELRCYVEVDVATDAYHMDTAIGDVFAQVEGTHDTSRDALGRDTSEFIVARGTRCSLPA